MGDKIIVFNWGEENDFWFDFREARYARKETPGNAMRERY